MRILITAAFMAALLVAGDVFAAPFSFTKLNPWSNKDADKEASNEEADAPLTSAIDADPVLASGSPGHWVKKWFGPKSVEEPKAATKPTKVPAGVLAYQPPPTTPSSETTAPAAATPAAKQSVAATPSAKNDVPEELSKSVVAQSQRLEAQGQVEQAHTLLVTHLTKNPYDVRGIRELGHLEDRRGNLEQAEIHYRQALGADAVCTPALNDLGLCLARQGRLEAASETLRQAIRLRPEKTLYRNNLAAVLVELDQHDEALTNLKAVYPTATATFNLGQLLARTGRNTAAERWYRDTLAMEPSHAGATQALAALPRQAPTVATEIEAAVPAETKPVVTRVAAATTQQAPSAPVTPETPISQPPVAEQSETTPLVATPAIPRLLPPVIRR